MDKRKQKGSAVVYFVFIAGAILGAGALAIEGSRYITEKAHLGDTMEAASVAVSESDDIRDENSFNESQAKEIASAWVDYLMPDNKKKEFTVSRTKEEYKKEVSGQQVVRTVHHYNLASTTTHDSWMSMYGLPSFEKQQRIFNKATAARVRTDFEPVDVVFVSDFSGSMSSFKRVDNLKYAIKEVTKTIFDGTQELKKKHPGENINDSSFGFVPFSKRVVFKKGSSYFCSSLLLPPKNSSYDRPRFEQDFSKLASFGWRKRDEWYRDIKRNPPYTQNEIDIMDKYISWAKSGNYYRVTNLDYNTTNNGGYFNHIDYQRTASEIQLDSGNLKLMTPMKMGQNNLRTDWLCSVKSRNPAHHVIERVTMSKQKDIDGFNDAIKPMRVGGGTDMYQALLAAPSQFYNAINKNRFIFVLSDGDENNDSFKKLVNKGLCTNIRNKMKINKNGESINFEMFVIGLKFTPHGNSYNTCFGKHIYTVNDLSKLKDVIMELLSSTTSYNIER
ncbi:pilus assembly protein [Photobacterium swingsii]|uniref:pilus assembly protein n=1 Tax=Photobacterium swingsii TaxID=680026 RepID=UPI00352EDF13